MKLNELHSRMNFTRSEKFTLHFFHISLSFLSFSLNNEELNDRITQKLTFIPLTTTFRDDAEPNVLKSSPNSHDRDRSDSRKLR